MAKKTNRENHFAILSLKVLYYHAKAFGLTYFTISDDNRVEYSIKVHICSVAYTLICSIGFALHLSEIVEEILATYEMYVSVVILLQVASIFIFFFVFNTSQAINRKHFISIINRSIDVLVRISVIAKDPKIFCRKFYLLLLARIIYNTYIVLLTIDLPAMMSALREKDYSSVSKAFFAYVVSFGILIMVDTLCLGYITSSIMYENIGRHMVALAKRIEETESRLMSKLQRKQVLRVFAKELDECSVVYSQIYKITGEFHSLFQLNIFFKFYFDLVTMIVYVHQNFLSYITEGHFLWQYMIPVILRTVDFLYLVLVIDMAVRRSHIPKYIHWDSLCSDIDRRWDRSVDSFLNRMRFEELKIDVYGLFQLNNELCLRVFSVLVAYLTILIQFSMLGHFKSGPMGTTYNSSNIQ